MPLNRRRLNIKSVIGEKQAVKYAYWLNGYRLIDSLDRVSNDMERLAGAGIFVIYGQ